MNKEEELKLQVEHMENRTQWHDKDVKKMEAMRNDRVEEWEAENAAIAAEAMKEGSMHKGRLLNLRDDTCEKVDGPSTVCKSHGTADWRDCRESLVKANFEENERRIMATIESEQHKVVGSNSRL